MFKTMFFDALTLLSVLIIALNAMVKGYIEPKMAALLVGGVTVALGLLRVSKMSLVRLAFRVGFPLLSLALFVIYNSNGRKETVLPLLGAVLCLLIALFAIYFMICGFRRKPQ